MRLFQLAQIWFGLLEFTQMFIMYANRNKFFLIYPDGSTVPKLLFQLPKFRTCWNLTKCFYFYPNEKWSSSILTKFDWSWFEVAQNKIKLFEVPQTWMKMFHLAQLWKELLPFAKGWFSLFEFTKIFPIYGKISNFTKIWMKLF